MVTHGDPWVKWLTTLIQLFTQQQKQEEEQQQK